MHPTLLPVAEAQTRLFALARPLSTETVPLAGAAGRWTAEAVDANRTQPDSDLSAMDGYAIRHADLPGPFALIGESAAGHAFSGTVGLGQTTRIFTGAAMPGGTDCVLVQEDAERQDLTIRLSGEGPPRVGSNVRPRGLDFSTGDALIEKGQRLTPAGLALAAIAGHATLPVARRLTVAIAATGDELAPPGTQDPGKLPETNGLMIAAMLRDLPVEIVDLGIIPDDLPTMTAAFAAVRADILVTTGGASVGDHDLVRPALSAAGGSIDFWRIALRPGKPMMAGRLGDAVVLGLPGNPVSAFVTAHLFLRPLIAAMSGATDPLPRPFPARLGEPIRANDHRQDYLRAELRDGLVFASTVQDSSMLRTLARANCLLVRDPHAAAGQIGDAVEILPIA
ncbi:molybdopterin molybdotransferase MoeA [Sphingomonas aliaeris]|uniref:Molybdopterin molybdenumtransferase n=1 Tax=Sphingomonas aliaeris TaxID=2759526 RepID=A0A974S5K2_9SPHN|nr:gephyrin-like molybdotransferase Glp [Sphingomonas aliaeris]QQV78521.1 molybdopterin molybdotransferase MoeA [Sphingomonas aliaeris]